MLEPFLSYGGDAEKVEKVEKRDGEGCIVNVANVVVVEGVVVGDAEDVPSSMVEVETFELVVVPVQSGFSAPTLARSI
jgi:hypothetical protein